jgi:hypothetical protein
MQDLPLQPPSLSPDEWRALVRSIDAAERLPAASVLNRLRQLLRREERPLAKAMVAPDLALLRRFIRQTRRHQRPANDIVPALLSIGFSEPQIEAVALLSLR